VRRLLIHLAFVAALVGALAAGPAAAQPPSNDAFGSPAVVSSLPFSDVVDTTEATTEPVDDQVRAACGVSIPVAKTVWYTFTSPVDQFVAVDTSGSTYSVGVGVVTGGPGNFSAVTCFAGSGSFFATAGQTYILGVADIGGGTGGSLNISISAPQPATVDIGVDRFGSFNPHTGVATVTGTGTCTESPAGQVSVHLTQQKGDVTTEGFGFGSFPCDGTEQPWSVEVFPVSLEFKGGHATVVAEAFACNLLGCSFDLVERTIVLRGGPPGA
jgi:hypothetical protein